jgi:hypothetical protein
VIKTQPLTTRETKPKAQYLQRSLGTNYRTLDTEFVPLTFYKGVFIITPQSQDLGHSLKSFKIVTGTVYPDRLMGCSDMDLWSKNMLPGNNVRTLLAVGRKQHSGNAVQPSSTAPIYGRLWSD